MAGDNLIFPTGLSGAALTSHNDLTAGTSFGALSVEASGYSITGNAIGLTAGLNSSQPSGSSTITLPVNFGSSAGTVTVSTTGAILALGGVITGTGGLTKQGFGELNLTATNNYTGPTTISGGVLHVDGAVSGSVAASSGTTLGGIGTVGSIATTSATVTPGDSGPGILTDQGALTFDSGSNYDVTLSGTTAGPGYSQLHVGGAISLANASLNLTISSGFVATPGSQFTIINNTGSAAVGGTFLGLPQGSTVTVSGQTFSISYTGGDGNDVVLTSVAKVTWSGADSATNDNWSDPHNWQGNTVPAAGNILVFPMGLTGSALTSNNDLTAGTSFTSITVQGAGYAIGGNSVVLTGPVDASQSTLSTTVSLPINFSSNTGFVSVDNSGAILVLSGVISGPDGLTKQGAGQLNLTAANDYKGTTTVSAGILHVNGSVQDGITVGSAATLGGVGTVGSIATTSATVSPGDTGPGILTDNGALAFDANSNFVVALNGTTAGTEYSQLQAQGPINLAGATLKVTVAMGFMPVPGTQFTIINNTGSAPVTGTFAGLSQGGTVTVSGQTFSVSYSGGDGNDVVLTARATYTWSGTDAATNDNWSDPNNWQGGAAPIAGNVLVFPSGLTGSAVKSNNDLTAGTSFNSLMIEGGGYTITGNAIALAGPIDSSQLNMTSTMSLPIDFGSITAMVTVDNTAATLSLGGVISGQAGLTKLGTGELDLTASNDYTGSTTVTAGKLHVDGTVTGAVAASTGTTLGGVGTVGSITTTSATVTPGDSGPGILTDTGPLTFDSGSSFNVALNSTTVGSGYSQLAVGGAINLAGATLNVTPGFSAPGGSKFTIINNTGSGAITGTFAGLAQGATITVSGQSFVISYTGGDGNDVVLTTLAPTTTAVTFSPAKPVVGETVTLSATVTSNSSGFGTPTGMVDFKNGTIDLGKAALNSSGVATLNISTLALGANSIVAVYSGDATFAPSASAATTVTVSQAPTTTTLVSSPNPSGLGAVVTLTATVVAASPGSGLPTGSVEFFSGSTDLGPGTLTNGIAILKTSNIPVGTTTLKANYSGDTNFTASSGTATQVVTAGTVSVALSVSNSNPFVNQTVTFTALVTVTSGTGTPTGTVSFFDQNGTDLGSGTLTNGTATLTTSALPIGKELITAVYSGDSSFGMATSPVLTVVVGSQTELFVNQVYLDVTGIPADASANFWIAQLNGGYPRGLIVQQIVGSSQASIAAVGFAYQTFLGRPATAAEVSAQLSMRHASSNTLNSSVLGSTEYFKTKGGGTINGFLTALANDVLGRSFTPAAQAHYARQLRRGVSRRQVALEVLTSPPGVNAQINTVYELILGRAADKQGLHAFAAPVRAGLISRVVASLLSSEEFLQKTVNL
jgi:autotransporter-associated beta strand protein